MKCIFTGDIDSYLCVIVIFGIATFLIMLALFVAFYTYRIIRRRRQNTSDSNECLEDLDIRYVLRNIFFDSPQPIGGDSNKKIDKLDDIKFKNNPSISNVNKKSSKLMDSNKQDGDKKYEIMGSNKIYGNVKSKIMNFSKMDRDIKCKLKDSPKLDGDMKNIIMDSSKLDGDMNNVLIVYNQQDGDIKSALMDPSKQDGDVKSTLWGLNKQDGDVKNILFDANKQNGDMKNIIMDISVQDDGLRNILMDYSKQNGDVKSILLDPNRQDRDMKSILMDSSKQEGEMRSIFIDSSRQNSSKENIDNEQSSASTEDGCYIQVIDQNEYLQTLPKRTSQAMVVIDDISIDIVERKPNNSDIHTIQFSENKFPLFKTSSSSESNVFRRSSSIKTAIKMYQGLTESHHIVSAVSSTCINLAIHVVPKHILKNEQLHVPVLNYKKERQIEQRQVATVVDAKSNTKIDNCNASNTGSPFLFSNYKNSSFKPNNFGRVTMFCSTVSINSGLAEDNNNTYNDHQMFDTFLPHTVQTSVPATEILHKHVSQYVIHSCVTTLVDNSCRCTINR